MASSTSASTSATSTTAKVCFNSNCKKALEHSRNGWRRRSGDFAELCDCCASAYEEGIFCETFHLNASGWRCCETCGKQIHCGCIVSFHMFVLLDAGGIECLSCTRKSFILTPNPAWPPPSLSYLSQPERIKDLPSKSSIAASSPVTWRQPPNLFSEPSVKTELWAKAPSEIDVSAGIGRLSHKNLSASSLEMKNNGDFVERLKIQSLKTGGSEVLENGNAVRCEDQNNIRGCRHTFLSKNDSSFPNINLAKVSSSKSGKKNHAKSSVAFTKPSITSTSVGKQTGSHTGLEMSAEGQVSNGRARENGQGRNHLLPPSWPRVTDQELQPVSGEANYVITFLFEKMLTPSDAGPMGRLILPKKCAETYLPPISHPEGLPLKVQDLKGNEWITQFRFWPNNNSRMYVLEGVTPCIQSMRLQAGDTVTFSRIEPGGKLVMGGRKTSTAPRSDQGNGTGDGLSANGKSSSRSAKPAINKCGGHVGKERVEAKPSIRGKRKNNTLDSKSKRLKTENENMTELKLTRRQAQGLMRQPPNKVPEVSVIEGYEIEEYEQDAPIIGRPTIPATDDTGEKIQWVQCEVCLKWRKMPADTLLPFRWTCSSNSLDPERSDCSAAQELTVEQLADLLPTVSNAAFKKIRAGKQEVDMVETLEGGLDALAELAIQEEGGSSQATTRHPRHKPGCTCIVCMQRPSGKGPKHKPTCDCMVCQSVKRRFKTLMTKREKKLEQDTDMDPSGEIGAYNNPMQESVNGESNEKNHPSPFQARIDLNIQPKRDEEFPPGTSSASLLHLLHDATGSQLRQQTHSSSGSGVVLVGNQNHQNGQGETNSHHEATESYLKQQPHSFSGGEGNPSHQNGQGETNFSSCSGLDKSHERMDADRHKALSGDTMISASTTQ